MANSRYPKNNSSGIIDGMPNWLLAALIFATFFGVIFYYLYLALHVQISSLSILVATKSYSLVNGLLAFSQNEMYVMAIKWLSYHADIDQIDKNIRDLHRLRPERLSFSDIRHNFNIGFMLARPFIIFLMIYQIKNINIRTAPLGLKGKMDIFRLIKLMAPTHQHLKPLVGKKLHKLDPDVGPWRREASPIRHAIISNLIMVYKRNEFGELTDELLVPTFDAKLAKKDKGTLFVKDDLHRGISKIHGRCFFLKDRAKEFFKAQLGSQYQSFDNMKPYQQALASVFIAYICDDKRYLTVLNHLNTVWKEKRNGKYSRFNKKINTPLAKSIYEKHKNDDAIKSAFEQHAFCSTLLGGLYECASGINAKQFIWLKLVDRTLFYFINDMRATNAYTESNGIKTHYLVECSVGAPIPDIDIEQTVHEFQRYLDESEGWLRK